MRRRRSQPPEVIDAGRGDPAPQRPADAEAVARAVGESLEHLEPWMPWAQPPGGHQGGAGARIAEVEIGWQRGTDFVYAMRRPDGPEDEIVGIIGLHRRIGPRAVRDRLLDPRRSRRRGYMTAAAKAVTEAAEALDDVDRVEIHTDEANRAQRRHSPEARLPAGTGRCPPPEAPGESGRLQIWVRP